MTASPPAASPMPRRASRQHSGSFPAASRRSPTSAPRAFAPVVPTRRSRCSSRRWRSSPTISKAAATSRSPTRPSGATPTRWRATTACSPPSPAHAASWLARGESLRFLERHDEALAAFERANQVAPTLAAAWTQRGNILRDQGRLDEARHAFEQALAHQGDPELNRYYLAALSGRDAPAQAPTAYVLRFFDEYASSFDEHLVGMLGYRAPEALVAQVAALAQRRFRSALDLGCGTGLCGPLLRPMCDRLAGVDLSPGMLAQAAARGVYDALVRDELVAHLRSTDARHDLLVAADVFIYVGALGPVFEGAARALAPDGLFAFTAEATANESDDVVLLPSLRYAHSERHLRALAAQQGLEVASLARAPLRREQEREVEGLYVILRR